MESGIHSLQARTGTYHRLNQVNHAAHNSFAFNISKPSVSHRWLYILQFTQERAHGSAASPATTQWSPTSVGRLISNRSSRLAFQWLMMSASFLLSSSLLPDMVDSLSDPLRQRVLLNKTSRNVSPQEKRRPPRKPVEFCYFNAGTWCGLSLLADRPTCCLICCCSALPARRLCALPIHSECWSVQAQNC